MTTLHTNFGGGGAGGSGVIRKTCQGYHLKKNQSYEKVTKFLTSTTTAPPTTFLMFWRVTTCDM
jgi:hypothetical protein